MNIKKTAVAMLCAVLLFVSGIVPDAFADWYDDISGGRYVDIKGDNYAVDYFCGVPALYNKGSTIYCNELVERFYRQAYGLDVDAGTSGISMKTEGYKFIKPSTPKPGDVVYVSAAQRGTYDHWAIVKSYDGTNITLFEQNVKNGGQAIVDRKLRYPSNSYNLYTPVSKGEKTDPVLKGYSSSSTTATEDKSTASTTVTTTATTTKPTTTTTTKPTTTTTRPTTTTTTTRPTTTTTTTKPTTTTTRPTTTKPTTTKPTTTRPTTTLPTTTETALSTVLSTTDIGITFMHIEITENYWQYTTTTTAVPETSEYDGEAGFLKAPVILGSVCGVLVVGVAFLIFMLIKKR